MSASAVVSIRLPQDEVSRLGLLAKRLGRTASEVGAQLLGESLRQAEFTFIEFRDSAVGRQPYIQGSRLAVWQVISLLRDYADDVAKTAAHLRWPEAKVHAARAYAQAYPDEIQEAIRDNEAVDFERLSRLLPGMQTLEPTPRKPP
ncbi:MAG TPA: transcriptional regulator [Verrucomicrobiota bacterium]|nr:transcriptional regulator [Verrucomicrobiota bacterium]